MNKRGESNETARKFTVLISRPIEGHGATVRVSEAPVRTCSISCSPSSGCQRVLMLRRRRDATLNPVFVHVCVFSARLDLFRNMFDLWKVFKCTVPASVAVL